MVVKGDSTLAIGMVAGGFRPGKPYFWLKVKHIRAIAKQLDCPVYWI